MSVDVRQSSALWNCDTSDALRIARDLSGSGIPRHRVIKFAFLNRACELACAPVHLRPVETAQGIEMAWYTYRPVASAPIVEYGYLRDGTRIPIRVSTDTPTMAVMLGYESELTEDQARNRAIGW